MTRLFPLAFAGALALLTACGGQDESGASGEVVSVPIADPERDAQEICGSTVTFARLKELAFADARQAPDADLVNLATLAKHSVVRMENPVVAGRDDQLERTLCSGRLVLELPPGTERAFKGQRRLVADVEYSAQPAADGGGLVYRMRGAERVIEALAGFDLRDAQPAGDLTNAADAAEPEADGAGNVTTSPELPQPTAPSTGAQVPVEGDPPI